MPTPDLIQGVNLPSFGDAPAVPTDIANTWYAAIARGLPRFANTAARDTAYPSPTNGQACWVDSLLAVQIYQSGWKDIWKSPGAGVWQAYTPTTPGTTLGNGTSSGRYARSGVSTVHAEIYFERGSTTTVATHLELGLPIAGVLTPGPAEAWFAVRGTAWGLVGGGAARYSGHAVMASISTVGIVQTGGTNNATRWGSGQPTPATWSTGDRVYASVTYEAS